MRKIGSKGTMSNLASCGWVPSQINLVFRELRWSRLDDIQVPKASMAMQHQRRGNARRPEHHLHTVGRQSMRGQERGKVRSINYEKKRGQHRALRETKGGRDPGGPRGPMNHT